MAVTAVCPGETVQSVTAVLAVSPVSPMIACVTLVTFVSLVAFKAGLQVGLLLLGFRFGCCLRLRSSPFRCQPCITSRLP